MAKKAKTRGGIELAGINQQDLESDPNCKAAYQDYQFITNFLETQMFVTYIETELD